MSQKQLAVLAAALFTGAVGSGCSRTSTNDTVTYRDMNQASTASAEGIIPSGWPQSSAANPLGWADAAERRQRELEFATGVDSTLTPPAAIGGGPTNFDD